MKNTNHRCEETQYTVRVSAANMPAKCWGRYCHVAVVAHPAGHTVSQIRDTRKQRVVAEWRRQHDGSTLRSASERALAAANDHAQDLRGVCRNETPQLKRVSIAEIPWDLDVHGRPEASC
jgi:hypothetical protein